MSATEKKLADFILENAPLVRDYSSQQIAGSVGVSQSSVVKFSQKLGYRGFTDLKLAIHESVVKRSSNVSVFRKKAAQGEEFSVRERLFQSKCDALSSANDLNDDALIQSVVAAIVSADRIQLIGVGGAAVIARDLAGKLAALGQAVMAESDAQVQLAGSATLGDRDCLIVISDTGRESAIVQIVKAVRSAGVTVISLTNQSANPISVLADIRLFSVSRGDETVFPDVISAASQQHVVDLLHYALVQQCGNKMASGKAKKTATLRQAVPTGHRDR